MLKKVPAYHLGLSRMYFDKTNFYQSQCWWTQNPVEGGGLYSEKLPVDPQRPFHLPDSLECDLSPEATSRQRAL